MTATDVDGLTDTTYFSVTTGPTVGGASGQHRRRKRCLVLHANQCELVW